MNDAELNTLLNEVRTPPCDTTLADRIIEASYACEQEKSFLTRVRDAVHSKYAALSLIPVAACVCIAIFASVPEQEEIDMLEYAEIFLVENGIE